MTLHKITEFYTERFSVCINKTSKCHTTATFKSFVKQNNNSDKTSTYVHDHLLYQTSLSTCNGSRVPYEMEYACEV
jgi:hypothetical protein